MRSKRDFVSRQIGGMSSSISVQTPPHENKKIREIVTNDTPPTHEDQELRDRIIDKWLQMSDVPEPNPDTLFDHGFNSDNLNRIIQRLLIPGDSFATSEKYSDELMDYFRKYGNFFEISIAMRTSANFHDPEGAMDYLRLCQEIRGNDHWRQKLNILSDYYKYQNLDKTRVEGFKRNVFPGVDKNDAKLIGVQEQLDYHPNRDVLGKFGAGDYKIHCLVQKVNPRNIRDLIQIKKDLPSDDYEKFTANREDARALETILFRSRQFIHDERPGAHELLSAMLQYYEASKDPDNPKLFAQKTEHLKQLVAERQASPDAEYYINFEDYAFHLENYDREVHPFDQANWELDAGEKIKAVNLLRRLVRNTAPMLFEKPMPYDEEGNWELDDLLEQFNVHLNKRTGEVLVDWNQVGALVKRANEILLAKQDDIGIHPSMVETLAYIEKMATYALRGIDRKDWRELPFDPYFKEIVKFRDLTSSADDFDNQKFEQFWTKFTTHETYANKRDRLDPDDPDAVRESYRELLIHIGTQLGKLAKAYKSDKNTAWLADSLWTGNLNHELIGLADRFRTGS